MQRILSPSWHFLGIDWELAKDGEVICTPAPKMTTQSVSKVELSDLQILA